MLTTDASPWAWGAILRMHGDVQTRQTSGFFTPKESRLTQNEREALGVRYGIAAFSSVLKTHLRQLPTRELMRLINLANVVIRYDFLRMPPFTRRMT